jgi:RHS repeat-associated protein
VLIAALVFSLVPPPSTEASIRASASPAALPSRALPGLAAAAASAAEEVVVCVVVVVADPFSLTKSAFGELLGHSGIDPQPYAFAGEPLDPNSDFQYHRARWMDPRTGRFASVDTFEGLEYEPLTLHKHLYVSANPVNLVDPSGLAGEGGLSGALTSLAVAVTIFTIRHPILTAVIGVVGSALIPEEVNNAMLSSGFPGFQAVGAVGQAEARGIRLIKNTASRTAAARELGQITNATGRAFERFAKRVLFPDFDAQEVKTGRHYLDLIWRGIYIELKTARTLDARELSQLAEFAQAAKAGGSPLAYVFLVKPTRGTIQKIAQAGGQVYYLFD